MGYFVFFIPVANLLVPYLVVRDMFNKVTEGQPESRFRPVLVLWWGLFLLMGPLVSYLGILGGSVLEPLEQSLPLREVKLVIQALASVSAFVVVHVISRAWARMFARSSVR